MNKPVLFFSHSSRDKQQLMRLKELFVEKTGGSVDVFLSSDGQSIPLGRNWVHRIQQALECASLMVVFVTPNSIRSNWIFFESGHAYAKGIRVVPVGFLGVDLTALPPPLSLLQGFNISSEEGLNNIVALANDAFQFSHRADFSAEEYLEVCAQAPGLLSQTFGNYSAFVHDIHLSLTQNEGMSCTDALDRVEHLWKQLDIQFSRAEESITSHGLQINKASGYHPPHLDIYIDPGMADSVLPLVQKSARRVCDTGLKGASIEISFIDPVNYLSHIHKLTARLYGTDVKFGAGTLLLEDIEFYLSSYIMARGGRGKTFLVMKFQSEEISVSQIHNLMELLFQRRILFTEEDQAYVEW